MHIEHEETPHDVLVQASGVRVEPESADGNGVEQLSGILAKVCALPQIPLELAVRIVTASGHPEEEPSTHDIGILYPFVRFMLREAVHSVAEKERADDLCCFLLVELGRRGYAEAAEALALTQSAVADGVASLREDLRATAA